MDPAVLREDMVDGLRHESRGCLESDSVAAAMATVPRHVFFEDDRTAYLDRDTERLGTRVLAPSTAARLFEALSVEAGDAVLIVGAGVGYTAALAAEITEPSVVQAVDITRQVVYEARRNLRSAGYDEVFVDCRNGVEGLPEYAPYDRILLEAAAVNPPRALLEQLSDDGRLVMPLGAREQTLAVVEDGEVVEERGAVAFRPMLVDGEEVGSIERNRMHREDRERASRAAQSRAGWEHDWIDWEGY